MVKKKSKVSRGKKVSKSRDGFSNRNILIGVVVVVLLLVAGYYIGGYGVTGNVAVTACTEDCLLRHEIGKDIDRCLADCPDVVVQEQGMFASFFAGVGEIFGIGNFEAALAGVVEGVESDIYCTNSDNAGFDCRGYDDVLYASKKCVGGFCTVVNCLNADPLTNSLYGYDALCGVDRQCDGNGVCIDYDGCAQDEYWGVDSGFCTEIGIDQWTHFCSLSNDGIFGADFEDSTCDPNSPGFPKICRGGICTQDVPFCELSNLDETTCEYSSISPYSIRYGPNGETCKWFDGSCRESCDAGYSGPAGIDQHYKQEANNQYECICAPNTKVYTPLIDEVFNFYADEARYTYWCDTGTLKEAQCFNNLDCTTMFTDKPTCFEENNFGIISPGVCV